MKDYIEIDYRPQPIWFATDEKKPKCKISDSLFVDLLKRNGFGVMDDNFVHRQESALETLLEQVKDSDQPVRMEERIWEIEEQIKIMKEYDSSNES